MDGFTCRGAWRGSAGGKRARAGAVTEYTPHAASIEHKATPLPHRGAAPAPTHNLRPCSCDRRDWCGGTAAEPRLESLSREPLGPSNRSATAKFTHCREQNLTVSA